MDVNASGLNDDDNARGRDYDYDTLLTESMEKIKQNGLPREMEKCFQSILGENRTAR